MSKRIGSLFSGAAGLDLAVQQVFGGEVVWHAEIDKAASKVLAHRFPGVPNLGSVTDINWAAVPPVDVLCGGFPCQDVSAAGKRAGITAGTRSGLWSVFAEAIDALRPRWVVIENVRGLLSATAQRTVDDGDPLESAAGVMGNGAGRPVLRAIGAVLGDLCDLGYDAQWATVAAADVGAPHRRERVFILATDASVFARRRRASTTGSPRLARIGGTDSTDWCEQCWISDGSQTCIADPDYGDFPDEPGVALLPMPNAQDGNGGGRYSSPGHQSTLPGEVRLLPTPRSSDCFGAGQHGDGGMDLRTTISLLPTPQATDHMGGGTSHPDQRRSNNHQITLPQAARHQHQWGKYEPAIRRWESIVGPAPAPTEPNKNGNPRLSAAFSEWMMGWPAGWVTDPAIGISRNDQLRIVGNGVCPQQAAAALRFLLTICEVTA